ncbi:TPA_asm: hypothetical protein GJA98_15030 [Listeria monocytogenes]|nr:hypothetical protein [Listeria monocytogenes]
MTDEEALQLFEDYVNRGYEMLVSVWKSEKSEAGELALKINSVMFDVLSDEEAFEYKCKLVINSLRELVSK